MRPDDRMVIVHTSGSTSTPKGVIHQHGPLLNHLATLNGLRGLDAGVRLFSNSPMFWIGGLGYNVVGTLVAGATLLCSAAPDPADTLDFIERERPELTNGFVASIASLIAHPSFATRDFSSIRSGNLYPLSPEGVRPADPELRHNMLGMTETGSVCLMSPDDSDQPERRRGSFGCPVPGLDARVVDPDTLEDVPNGVLGELWFRGPALMEGYDGVEHCDVFTADEWYRTGDLFTVDDEGFYFFKGRRGDMIKTAGANVSPREVESALREVTGGLDALVIGIPDAERGQIVGAVVIAEPERAVDLDRIRDDLRARLSAYKVPQALRLHRSRRPADALERQTRPAPDRGARSMSTMSASPSRGSSAGGPRCSPTRPFVVTDDDTLSYGAARTGDGRLGVPVRDRGSEQGHPSRHPDAERHRVADRRDRSQSRGRDRRAVEHAAPSAGTRRAPADGGRSSTSCSSRRSGDRDYVADLAAISPRLVPASDLFVEALPRLRSITLWDAERRRQDEPLRAELVESLDAAVRPADDLVVIFTPGSRRGPEGVIHTHGGALGATAAGLEARRLGPDDRPDVPMPFSSVEGFGTGFLSTLIAGATLRTESRPQPEPTQPFVLGMTECFGPYCDDRLARPLPGVEVRIVDLDAGAPVGAGVVGEIQLRGPNLMRGICGRTRRETFTPDGFYPTGALGRLDANGYVHLDRTRSERTNP